MKKLIFALAYLLLAVPCVAGTITVDDNGPADFNNIQAAIDAAADGDTIIVSPGTYTGSGNHDIDFLGKAITVRSADPNDPNIVSSTIIDCQNSGRGFYFYGGEDANSILAGFTIKNGYASVGGGIRCESSSPTITGCTFTGNLASSDGGGVYNFSSSPTITNCIFVGNSASDDGGGVCNLFSSPTITNCIFVGNSASDDGGGVYNSASSSPTVTNCTFSSNSASRGGGMFNSSSSPTVANCILWGNTATLGAQIYNYGTPPPPIVVIFSDVQGGYTGTGNINADPLFVNAAAGDLHLSPRSPCIDAGYNSAVPAEIVTDLDGNPRFVDDPLTRDTGLGTPPLVDMGTFEYRPGIISNIIYVDANAAGANNGLTWEDAYKYLQNAITVAEPNFEIWVAQGTYRPDEDTAHPFGTNSRDATFQLKNGVALYGGFPSGGLWEDRDPNTYVTILSGDIGTVGNNSDNSYHVVTGSGTNSTAILDGFTITAGKANGSSSKGYGAGMYNSSGSPTVTNCIFSSNSAGEGGGMYNSSSSNPAITNCVISKNIAGDAGGAIYCYQSSPSISTCTITGNEAFYIGGIYCRESSPNITACIISNNIGSGIAADGPGCYTTITDCTISGNSDGGIIDCNGPITNCTITGNSAEYGGGMYYCTGPITNCIIANNSAEYEGGGLARCDSLIANCTITGNSAKYGGGMYMCYGTIENCIISNNDAGYYGGGLAICSNVTNCTIIGNIAGLAGDYHGHCGGGIYSVNKVTNCIIWDNWPEQVYSADVTYSNVQDGWSGQGNIDADPCLAFDTDYHITPDSPCVDAGTNDPCGGLPATDIEGTPRPLDGNGDGNAVADMGAYELIPDSPFIAVSESNLYFTQDWPDTEPQTKTLIIKNCGGEPLNWQIIEDCNWLQISPESGTGQISEVNVTIDPNDLAPGRYTCGFEIQDINALNNPVTVHVAIGQVLLVPQDFNTIQKAIDAADNADTVLVADGTYKGTGNKNLDFHGKLVTVRSENGPNNCIIDCQRSGYGFHFQNRESDDSVVDGFTIIKALAGIYCDCRSSPTIENCIIQNSGSPGCSGITCGVLSNPVIAGCTITGSYSYGVCYGFTTPFIYTLDAAITNSTISNNSEGGVYAGPCNGNLTVTNCSITNNGGLGLICGDPEYAPDVINISLEITNSVITGNTRKGGIICGSKSKITDCNISNNSGCGIHCYPFYGYSSSPTITNCTITGNSMGSGIYCADSDATIANCILSGNSASKGGGIYCDRSSPTITNCTFSGNSANYGGAMSSYSSSSPTVANCILWGNTATTGAQIYNSSSTTTVSFSDVQGGWPGLGNIDADPCFVDADANDYHLKSAGWRWDSDANQWTWDDVTSRCIDAGNPGSPLADEPLTLIVDPLNRWGQNLRIDMGFFGGTAEASMPPYDWALLADLTNDGLIDLADFAYQAADWLNSADQQPGDLNRNNLVDVSDLALLIEDWLKQTTWHE
ncbi:MAG: right-handed parallel beta-helix repeat-containing protein [Sedimentisphaerales bacterium]